MHVYSIFAEMANSIVVHQRRGSIKEDIEEKKIEEEDREEADTHWRYFPPFLWLLRDVLVTIPVRDGKELTPTEYLKTEVLCGGSSNDSVRRALTQFFPSFKCQTLPPPSTHPDVMKDVGKRQKDLDFKFNQGVDELITFLYDTIKPKRVADAAGSTCDGETLAALVEQVSKQVNDTHSIPAIDNTWKMVVEARCRAVQKKLVSRILHHSTGSL